MITAIIQARINSTRLFGKVLMDLPFGSDVCVLDHIVNRLRKVPVIQRIILATSVAPEDDRLEEYAIRRGIQFFRGSQNNVLERMYQAADQFSASIIIRLTGDNPIVDSSCLQNSILQFQQQKIDYLQTSGLPLGTNFEIFTFQALKNAFTHASEKYDLEHVTPFIRQSQKTKQSVLRLEPEANLADVRLTLDYPEDYLFLNLLFNLFNSNPDFGISEIKTLKEKSPWIFHLNANAYHKKQYANETEELRDTIGILSRLELTLASKILSEYLNRD